MEDGGDSVQGAYGLRTGRAEWHPLPCWQLGLPVLPVQASSIHHLLQCRGRLLLEVMCEQEGWLQAGKAGDTTVYETMPSCQPAGVHQALLPSWSWGQLWIVGMH